MYCFVGGTGNNSFALSQLFLQRVSSSPFPTNTGKRAAKFSNWLYEREKDLIEEGINLPPDLQCGDIFQLFALVSLGELSIQPSLPDEGVGEAEDSRRFKRRTDNAESGFDHKAKKQKYLSVEGGEVISRREKGFPGLMLSLSRVAFSRENVIELLKDEKECNGAHLFDKNEQYNTPLSQKIGISSINSDHFEENIFCSTVTVAEVSNESPWESMKSYAEHLMSIPSDRDQENSPLYPELFRTVYTAIQNAGDQGLSMEQVFKVMDMQGRRMSVLIVEVLQAFGRVIMVNGFESVHVVDSLYRSKYHLTSKVSSYEEFKPASLTRGINDGGHLILESDDHEIDGPSSSQREISMKIDDLHSVTILNLPEDVSQIPNKISTTNEVENDNKLSGDSCSFRPILPWLNGDGTVNAIVYKGLTRRVLGTVMQNPGILEDEIISRMDVLNPQSCRKLLELMILDNHLIVRKMHQTKSGGPPTILGNLLEGGLKKARSIFREHFFANPMSTYLL